MRLWSPKGLYIPFLLLVMFFLAYLLLNHLSHPAFPYSATCSFCQLSTPLSHTAIFSGRVQSFSTPCSGNVTSGHVFVSSLVVCLKPQHHLSLSKSCAEKRTGVDPKSITFLILKKIPYGCAPLFKNSAFHVLFVLPLRLMKKAAFGRV